MRQVSNVYPNLVLFETVNPNIPGAYTNIYLAQSRYSDIKLLRVSAYDFKLNIKITTIDDAGDINFVIGNNDLSTWNYALNCNTGSAIIVPFTRNGNTYTLNYEGVLYYEYSYNVIFFQLTVSRDAITSLTKLDDTKPLISLASDLNNPCINK